MSSMDTDCRKAVASVLKPGGWLVIYNLSPAPNVPRKPYRPNADGRCPFSAEHMAAAGFETLVRDGVDDKAARALGAALGWDKAPVNMKLEDDLFALVTIARKKPLTKASRVLDGFRLLGHRRRVEIWATS